MTVDLVMELSDDKRKKEPDATSTDEKAQSLKDRQELAQAFDAFHQRIQEATSEDQKKLKRNQIQSRLISASEMACTEFERNLNNIQAGGNFAMGTFSTVLAGAGAIVTRVDMARLLSGSSAILTGVRSEFNAEYFYKQTAAFITKAIDSGRKEAKEAMRQAQQRTYSEYTIEDAIGDAIAYNDACSLIVGLQRVGEAVTTEEDPGLQRLSKLLNRGGKIQTNDHGLVLTVNRLSALQEEVSEQIKGIHLRDDELELAMRSVQQSSEILNTKIQDLEKKGLSVNQNLKDSVKNQTTMTIESLGKFKVNPKTLAKAYFLAVEKVTKTAQDETAFLTARANFYEQLAKVSGFRQDIDSQLQEFDSKLKPIRDELDKLALPPPSVTVTNSTDQSTITTPGVAP